MLRSYASSEDKSTLCTLKMTDWRGFLSNDVMFTLEMISPTVHRLIVTRRVMWSVSRWSTFLLITYPGIRSRLHLIVSADTLKAHAASWMFRTLDYNTCVNARYQLPWSLHMYT